MNHFLSRYRVLPQTKLHRADNARYPDIRGLSRSGVITDRRNSQRHFRIAWTASPPGNTCRVVLLLQTKWPRFSGAQALGHD